MVSSAIWKKHAQVSFSKTIKKLTSACFFAQQTMLLLINNIHEKIMRHVQNNLFPSDCQYFHSEKIFVRTTEVKQCVLNNKNC